MSKLNYKIFQTVYLILNFIVLYQSILIFLKLFIKKKTERIMHKDISNIWIVLSLRIFYGLLAS